MSRGAPAPPRLDVRPGGALAVGGPAFREIVRDALARGLSLRFRARGISMAPFIRDGDILTLRPLRPGSPNRGDVVAFTPPGRDGLIVHRVIRKTGGGYVIKGDGLAEKDGCVPRGAILGIVGRVERRGRDIRIGLGPGKSAVSALSRLRVAVPAALRAVRRLRALAGRRRP